MSDSSDPTTPGLRDPIGLCVACRHVRLIGNRRGSLFYRCTLAEVDPRFPKYPRLPVLRCAGFEPASSGESGEAAD